ncbi:MAG: DUF4398 domain-containing protein [Wenzhouxiangella sp.]|nr:MAG: DUF4398 domain-containing protein [Wenzhouxiangella sp.]
MPRHLMRTSAVAVFLALTACATTPPDPRLLDNAELALRQAEQAGAEEYAPLELRFARERLEAARAEMDNARAKQARHLADEAEIEAQLALARTRAARTRAELAQRQRDLESLRADLLEAFGEQVMER